MTSYDGMAYSKATADYEENWRVMDDTLYRLCKDNPGHDRRSSVCAKLWIIGRTYATGIERKIVADGTQGSSNSQVTDYFLKHAVEIDSWFSELRTVTEPLDSTKLVSIVSLHGRLVQLLSKITRNSQSTRSFVSKYMHFHNRSVPIYDSVADSALRRLIRWNAALAIFDMPIDADSEYGWFVMRFFRLYEQVRMNELLPTVRHVDYYLLSLAESSYMTRPTNSATAS